MPTDLFSAAGGFTGYPVKYSTQDPGTDPGVLTPALSSPGAAGVRPSKASRGAAAPITADGH